MNLLEKIESLVSNNKEYPMQFLKLVEALAAVITPDNINNAVDLVEKLIALAEKIDKQAQQ